jgi:carboxylesterase type B
MFEKVNIKSVIVFAESVNEKGEKETLSKSPVIVWIHGGGFTFSNDKKQS